MILLSQSLIWYAIVDKTRPCWVLDLNFPLSKTWKQIFFKVEYSPRYSFRVGGLHFLDADLDLGWHRKCIELYGVNLSHHLVT